MRSRTRTPLRLALAAALAGGTLVAAQSTSSAVPPASEVSGIDDFEDNNAGDWIFFGGNAAGGGGGTADDRPREGAYYFSTGWGGNGTASGFYGGAFKNFDNAGQVAVPADPWFNVWIYQQSDTTVDQYTLELTLREDTDGDGWTSGAEDSIGLDTTFTTSDFDDRWKLLSAPLSSFADRGTGGNGVFDGNLDEVVIVFGGVQGAAGSVIEIDFDQFVLTPDGPLAFDDMEHGDPFGNGWFSFNGNVGGGGIGPNGADLPPANGGAFSLQTGWGSGGAAGFFGGFGRANPTDLSGTDHFNFWINPDAGQDYTLEVNLQEDDNGDRTINQPDDDEFQYNCVVGPSGPCAVAGGGWQLVSIPLGDFFDDNSFLFGGNGVLDAVPPAAGGNGELINVVVAVVSNTGADVTFRTDYWAFTNGPLGHRLVDDFESGLPFGSASPNGELIGFYTFQGDGTVAISTASTPPAPPLTAAGSPNNVMQMDVDVSSFAGYIHAFENPAVDAWVTQDWSTSVGISLWMFGTGSGTQMFIDILDNRNPGSTSDDAERWTVPFVDDFTGWQRLEFPFSSFVRKEIGNSAPNDGLGLFQMHGYALGTLGTGGPLTVYFDEVKLYGIAEPPELAVNFSKQNTFIEEGTTGDVGVKLNRPMGPDDPAEVTIDFATERANAVPGEEFTPTSGTLTFVNGGPSELFFPVETFDDTKFEGDEQIVIRLTNPVDVDRGALFQGSALIADNDPFDPKLLDDFEQGAFLWDTEGPVELDAVRTESTDPDARPGQDAVENVGVATVPVNVDIDVDGPVCNSGNGVVPIELLSTPTFDATTVDHTTVTLGGASETHVDKKTGVALRHVDDVNGDGLDDLVFHFRYDETGLPCDPQVLPFAGLTFGGQLVTNLETDAALIRDFPIGQDWTGTERLDFWYYGAGGGEEITVTLKDNRAPDPGPSGWELAWSDEFDEPAGSPPNPANWAYEIGDTTPDGKNGWGNEELQYYTDDPANAATDGAGNLVITLDEADGSQECYYGPCEFESARLLTQNKAEFAYGRIESRLLVPDGGPGLWPAFWSLGTDITYNPWPGAGEIDIMEYVSRIPNEIFGTIHGPGYNGGGSFNGIYDFSPARVDEQYHTFTVEWEPDLITWYVDGIQYHQATPADVAPNPWVFEKPFFLLLNFAIGGNFGGAIDPDNVYPQEYLVDYIRVYQGPDTAERWEASFMDDFVGWQRVTVPFTDLTRSDDQPAGAPDDGLTLTDVWGYGFDVDGGTATGSLTIDEVRVDPAPPPTAITVTNLNDSGSGSLRKAVSDIAAGGTITFDPSLAGGTVNLFGPIVPVRNMTIDGTGAPGISLDGDGFDRVLIVEGGVEATIKSLTLTNGIGFQLAGCVLNNGILTLELSTVTGCVMTTDSGDFWQGGAGVYNGEGATFTLIDSSVSGNISGHAGGGVFSFFGTTTTIERSTISGNTAADVGGGMRSLGNVDVINSTISGNTASASFHGGAVFVTDGVMNMVNTTVAGNTSTGGTGDVFVGTFTGASATVNLTNTIIQSGPGSGAACFQGFFGAGAVTLNSNGGNLASDGTCNLTGAGDLPSTDALLGPLADNGGPTQTHALGAGSPAIDAADGAACPATDQRGVARTGACDIGSYERE